MLQALLIEIGVEELPAVPLLKELDNIEKKMGEGTGGEITSVRV